LARNLNGTGVSFSIWKGTEVFSFENQTCKIIYESDSQIKLDNLYVFEEDK
jgi:hypothetical protein